MKVKARIILGITEQVSETGYERHYNYADAEVEILDESYKKCDIIGGVWLTDNPELLEQED